MPALKGNRLGANHIISSDICPGCGQTEGHRPDCTVEPAPLRCWVKGCTVVRMAGVKTPVWRFSPSTGYLCPEHQS